MVYQYTAIWIHVKTRPGKLPVTAGPQLPGNPAYFQGVKVGRYQVHRNLWIIARPDPARELLVYTGLPFYSGIPM